MEDFIDNIPWWYKLPALLVGSIVGLGIWIATLFSWGFFGIIFGWIPGLIAAWVVGLLWPLVLLASVFLFSHFFPPVQSNSVQPQSPESQISTY